MSGNVFYREGDVYVDLDDLSPREIKQLIHDGVISKEFADWYFNNDLDW
jgi:hypothetical protein